MTEKKPPGMSAERWIDQQVREARDRGDFGSLPGYGKPIRGIDQPYDELWWAREFIERERLTILPETLRLRRDIEVFKERLSAMALEPDVRAGVQELNERIFVANSRYIEGPPAPVWPLDEERLVARWRRERTAQYRVTRPERASITHTPASSPLPDPGSPRRRTLWLGLLAIGMAAVSVAAAMTAW